MRKAWMAALACMGVFCSTSPVWEETTREPKTFVLDKLKNNDLVFLGTTHRQPVILDFLGALIPLLRPQGVTHLALEITSDQQEILNSYLGGDAALEAITLHTALECRGYRNLLKTLRHLPPDARPRVLAIDLPAAFYRLDLNRDQWMASRLIELLHQSKKGKVLAVLGSVHVLRCLPWQAGTCNSHQSIRTTLQQSLPGLSVASIINIASGVEKNCDFVRAYGNDPGGVALDLDPRFEGWKLGPVQCMAIRPAQAYELVESVIVHERATSGPF